MKIGRRQLEIVRRLGSEWRKQFKPIPQGKFKELLSLEGHLPFRSIDTKRARISILQHGAETHTVLLVEYKDGRKPLLVKHYTNLLPLEERDSVFRTQRKWRKQSSPIPKPKRLFKNRWGNVGCMETYEGIAFDELFTLAKTKEEHNALSELLERFNQKHPSMASSPDNLVVNPKTGGLK